MHLSGPKSEPQPRAGHGMCGLHNGRKLAVFGGRTADGRTNELFFYDTGALFINILLYIHIINVKAIMKAKASTRLRVGYE